MSEEPKTMITHVRVGRLKTTGSYSNYRVEVEAALQAGDDPQALRERLTAWVDDQIAREEGQQKLIVERDNLAWQVGNLEKTRDQLRKQVIAGNEIIAKQTKLRDLGVEKGILEPDTLLGDEIPF